MKKIAYLLTLIMLLVPLAGCAGDDDDNSIEGDWYRYESLVLVIYQNGTLGMGIAGPVDDFGNWSTEGDILTIDFGDSNTPTGDPRTMIARFAVDGDWLWMSELERNEEPKDDVGGEGFWTFHADKAGLVLDQAKAGSDLAELQGIAIF